MKAEFILLFSIILLIILVFIGINKKEAFTSMIDKTIDYTNIKTHIDNITNNFINDIDNKITFTVNDPDGYFDRNSTNYSSMNRIGEYWYYYGQYINNLQKLPNGNTFEIIPSISIDVDSSFVVLNDSAYDKTNISKNEVNMDKSSKTFVSMVNLYDDISGILKTINVDNISTKEQIHEYNMLLFTEVLFSQIIELFSYKFNVGNSGNDISGNDTIKKYDTLAQNIVNGIGQRIPAFLYYVIPYYTNNTYNIPDLKVNFYNSDPNTILGRGYIHDSMISFCYYKECIKLNQHPIPQALATKFQY